MKKIVKLTEPSELAAAVEMKRLYEEYQKNTARSIANMKAEVESMTREYQKLMREQFRTATAKHLQDPDDAFSKTTHFVNFVFSEFGDAYLCPATDTGELPESEEAQSLGDVLAPRKIVLN
jgi:hypothetical protein